MAQWCRGFIQVSTPRGTRFEFQQNLFSRRGIVGSFAYFFVFFFLLNHLSFFLFNVLVNNFSLMLGWSHRFLGIYQYFGELVSCSRILHGDRGVRTRDLSPSSPTLYHLATFSQSFQKLSRGSVKRMIIIKKKLWPYVSAVALT